MDPVQYGFVKQNVKQILGIDLDCYKERQMVRRLNSWLLRSGSEDWENYFQVLTRQDDELIRFRDYLTINVSSFFRDDDRWVELREAFLPAMLAAGSAMTPLKIWSAGCSIGAEPYTLAMIMRESFPTRKYQILATDFDRGALKIAREGGPYNADMVKNLTRPQMDRFLAANAAPYYLNLKEFQHIDFQEHNLLSDPFQSGFDMIVCRNVTIYFTNEAKSILYQKFHQSLRDGGILFLGGTEFIPRSHMIGFKPLGGSFYQKVDLPNPA